MKMISKNFVAAILLFAMAALPLRAQTNETAQLENTNAPAQTEEVVTNVPVVKKAKKIDTAPVRIDDTGIHVGGKDPVDINIPRGLHGSHGSNWIPIIAILMVFGMPVAIVGMFLYFRHRKARMLHETVRAMVEKGVPIPPELFTGSDTAHRTDLPPGQSAPRHQKDLRNGAILIAIGAGVTVIAGKVGLIILFIGVAMVVIPFIEKRNTPNPPNDK